MADWARSGSAIRASHSIGSRLLVTMVAAQLVEPSAQRPRHRGVMLDHLLEVPVSSDGEFEADPEATMHRVSRAEAVQGRHCAAETLELVGLCLRRDHRWTPHRHLLGSDADHALATGLPRV